MKTPVQTVKLTDLKIELQPPVNVSPIGETLAQARRSHDPCERPVEAAATEAKLGDQAASPQPKPVVVDVRTAHRWNAECLHRYRQASERQLVARGRFNLALRDWENATMQTVSPDQLIRSHIDAETKLRADVKAGLVSPRKTPDQPGPSAIDRLAFYSKNSGRRPGGGNSFRRGGQDKNAEVRREAQARAELVFRAKQLVAGK
ncbi:MAG: hypothetical protein ABSD31_21395 [Candidatus Binataceae bacterium]|jgi:hypothetical protein